MNERTSTESDDTSGSGWRRPAPEITSEPDETEETHDVEGHAQVEGLPAAVKPSRNPARPERGATPTF